MTESSASANNTDRPLRVLISGGGTGGHIFPALAIAGALRRRDPRTEILFVGALGRMEMERVPKAGYDIEGLPVAGFDRRRLWRNFGVLLKLMRSLRRASAIVRRFQPDVAVGVGGYASGPVLRQAQKRGIPTLLQEQNSYAGVTNKILAKQADAICVAYEGMERFFPAGAITLTGNPVRAGLTDCTLTQSEAKLRLGFDPERPLILVTGGSLGARTVNEATAAAIDLWEQKGYSVMWQTGRLYADECRRVADGRKGIKADAFIDSMETAYRAADLVVARAGASTISELQILGKAAVLIPSPNVAEDHQTKNAHALARRDAAVMITDAEARQRLGETVTSLLDDPGHLKMLEDNVLAMALPGADDLIAGRIFEIARKKQSEKTR